MVSKKTSPRFMVSPLGRKRMIDSILNENSKKSLKSFLKTCESIIDIDTEMALDVVTEHLKYHEGKEYSKIKLSKILELEKRWYKSLEENNPDYSVYSDPYYFCEVWLCWTKYSRNYLKEISRRKVLNTNKTIVNDIDAKVVVDLGCGFGYTTAGLKELFPKAKVYGTNIKDSSQYKFAVDLGIKRKFEVVDSFDNIKADLIFASEYFEHFSNPIEHLKDVIIKCNPKYMVVANSFGAKAIGHFMSYGNISSSKMENIFSENMIHNGYTKTETSCWNDRPKYWKKNIGKNIKHVLYD